MHGSLVSPSLGIYATGIGPPPRTQHRRAIRDRHGVKSAPANLRYRRREKTPSASTQNTFMNRSIKRMWTSSTPPGLNSAVNDGCHGDQMLLKVDDVINLAEQTREAASQENRRTVLEEAHKSIRHEVTLLGSSRPHSVIGMGLQALTSPMPLSAKDRNIRTQMDHIPTLLPLPSDRTFIPSPDMDNPRHANTPIDDLDEDERSHSVARQCCEIMGRSMCKSCQKLERRLLNREKAEREFPRMRISQQNITTTQVVKRFFPHLTESEIQYKIARGEIARVKLLSRKFDSNDDDSDSDSDSNDEDDKDVATQQELTPVAHVVVAKKKKSERTVIRSDNPLFALTRLKSKLKGLTSTPLFFTDLKGIQSKILSGEVDRKKHLIKPPTENTRLKSAVSTLSTTSSNKSTLSKVGLRLSESLMPVFVSPRKIKIYQEPSYKVFFEPPLLSKRRQIPNPSFFAGSSEAYSLPERLPDIIEFADSKIKALEKQGRSTSSMSFTSNISEDIFDFEKGDPLSSSRKEFEKSDKEGEGMLGESLSSSTPRMWLKSTNDVIDENFAGEEEHARDNSTVVVVSEGVGESHALQNGDEDVKTVIENEPIIGTEIGDNEASRPSSENGCQNVSNDHEDDKADEKDSVMRKDDEASVSSEQKERQSSPHYGPYHKSDEDEDDLEGRNHDEIDLDRDDQSEASIDVGSVATDIAQDVGREDEVTYVGRDSKEDLTLSDNESFDEDVENFDEEIEKNQ